MIEFRKDNIRLDISAEQKIDEEEREKIMLGMSTKQIALLCFIIIVAIAFLSVIIYMCHILKAKADD